MLVPLARKRDSDPCQPMGPESRSSGSLELEMSHAWCPSYAPRPKGAQASMRNRAAKALQAPDGSLSCRTSADRVRGRLWDLFSAAPAGGAREDRRCMYLPGPLPQGPQAPPIQLGRRIWIFHADFRAAVGVHRPVSDRSCPIGPPQANMKPPL